MNQRNCKIFVSVLIIATILVIFFIYSKVFYTDKLSNSSDVKKDAQVSNAQEERIDSIIDSAIKIQLDYPAKANEDIVNENGDSIGLGTTPNHWKELGIDNAEISSEEERDLYQMVAEAVKAQLKYSASKKEESLEEVKNLYLSEEFEQYKRGIIDDGGYRASGTVYHIPTDEYYYIGDIKTIRFSKPRIYGELPDRIGVLNDFEFSSQGVNNLVQIFIFKNVNGEWKIERQRETVTRLDLDEDSLIKEIKDGK